jgi:hypothetical protein
VENQFQRNELGIDEIVEFNRRSRWIHGNPKSNRLLQPYLTQSSTEIELVRATDANSSITARY